MYRYTKPSGAHAHTNFALAGASRASRLLFWRFSSLHKSQVHTVTGDLIMASGVSYPLQLSSVTESHAALYEESLKHPEQFWGDLARRRLRWTKEFDQVMDCDMNSGQFKWFIGGVINVSGERRKSRFMLFELSKLLVNMHVLNCVIDMYFRTRTRELLGSPRGR